ncbi:MAG: flagellar hook-associated protein FlgK, partial [Fibromonadaceae bacterium]|jgi:flagellar hook-associated protein 1 FlgK|nr:flagellar hook-associated protein FlgK [Fibromonadaceae bacterium]
MSLFEGLGVATRGLAASQLGINVSGQNITNAFTDGYSRKRIEQNAEWRRDGSFGQMGFGVEVYAINRVRDQFIDRLVNQEQTRFGYFSIKDTAYNRIESVFQEPKDHALNQILKNFWNNWMDVANNPNDAGARQTLRSTTESMTTQFNYIATQLREYKDTINGEIESRVDEINKLTAGIHKCNAIITNSENLTNKANDTRDQRDLMLEKLAKITDVDYFEEENGALIVTSNGNMLVSATKNHELSVKRIEHVDDAGYQYSKIEITFGPTGKPFIPKNGELKALMEVRDVNIPEYESYINELARSIITEVNNIHNNGFSLSGLTFIDFFDSDPTKFNAANMSLSTAVKKDVNNIAAGVGGKTIGVNVNEMKLSDSIVATAPTAGSIVDLKNAHVPHDIYVDLGSVRIKDNVTGLALTEGTDYTVNYSTGIVTFTSARANDVEISYGYTIPAFNVPQLVDGGEPYVVDLTDFNTDYRFIEKNSLVIKDPKGNLLQEGKDYDIDYNTAKITFKYSATNAFADPSNPVSITFDYHKAGYGGPGDGENALLISQLRDKAVMQGDIFGRKSQTIDQFYTGALGRLGTERNTAAKGLETRQFALEQLKTQQNQIAGVDMNEEIANLIQFQHTYQASARYFSTINTMLDTLLNM